MFFIIIRTCYVIISKLLGEIGIIRKGGTKTVNSGNLELFWVNNDIKSVLCNFEYLCAYCVIIMELWFN